MIGYARRSVATCATLKDHGVNSNMHRHFKLAGLLALLAGTALTAGQPPQDAQTPPPQTPTFKVQVDYVEVDLLVSDEQGQLVRDLKKEDFQVFEDGKPQTISAFSLVDIPVEAADRPLFSTAPIEPDVESNERPFDGRVYVLLLDDLHTDVLRTAQVRRSARQFIEKNLGANDLMAVVHTGGRTDAAQDFTNNKRLLLAAVDKFMGRKLPAITLARNEEYRIQRRGPAQGNQITDPYDLERGYNAQSTLGSLRKIAEWFGGVRGRRKTLLFISEGIEYDITDIVRRYSEPGGNAASIQAEIREAIDATARSNVTIYAIDPRGLGTDDTIGVTNFADRDAPPEDPNNAGVSSAARGPGIGLDSLRNEVRMAQESLRTLADESGGFAAVNRNDFTSAFGRIVSDNSTYYVLAYYPTTTTRDGKFHRIEVRVNRPGLTVRSRRGYVSPKGNPPAPKPTDKNRMSAPLLEALNSPIQVSGLALRVFAAPFKGPAPNASVVLGVEMLGKDLALLPNGKVEIAYVAVDAKGKTHASKSDSLTTNLKPETRTHVQRTGFRILNRFELPPGRYQLHVAVHDTGNRNVGSVIYDLEVPEYSKLRFGMSGLVLTSPSGTAIVTTRHDELLAAVLPAPPIAQRTFPQDDEILLFAEVYDDGTAPAHTIDITTTVKSDDGRVRYSDEVERSSSELQGKRGGYEYTARVPLTDLEPGPYILSVEARSRAGEHMAASRQVRFTVTPPAAAPAR